MRLIEVVAVVVFFGIAAVAESEDCSSIASQYRQSTVFISAAVTDKNTGAVNISYGTGVIVAKDGLVLTDAHVLGGSAGSDSSISGAIGSREAPKTHLHLLTQNDSNDVAILQFADTSRQYVAVAIGNPWVASVGQTLCSMGYPLDAEFQTTEGPLGSKGAGHGLWFTQMPSNPGESGAPVFRTEDATLIALKLGEHDAAHSLNYLVPINMASSLLRDYAGLEVPTNATVTPAQTSNIAYQNQNIDCAKSSHPFGRGFCAVVQCPQGQWSRGSAVLLSKSGALQVSQGLETDNLLYGVCGVVNFKLLGEHGVLAYGFGPQRCIPAKLPGPAEIRAFAPDVVQVPAPIANQVKTIEVSSACSRDVLSPLGLGFEGDATRGTINVMLGPPPP